MILSTEITREADIIGETEWVNCNDVSSWIKAILKIKNKKFKRKSNMLELQAKGYDMKTTVEFLQNFYLK